jgi:hypothetical protein
MATIIIKNSTGSGAVPPSLTQGELAINVVDGKLFYGSGSGNIVKEFTGSGGGSAISASYALTASYAANGGVTQLLAGPNITLSPTNGLGQVTVSSTAGGGGFNTATGSYGSFYDTTIQTNPVANVPRSMSFDSTDITNGVSISGSTSPFNTYIKTENAGVYNIQFSAQVEKTDSGTDVITIWLRKNGIDLTDSATKLTLSGNGTKVVAAWNWFALSAANDYYQIIWVSADTGMRLYAEPINDTPGIPSVILTVNRVDQFLSNTGSFSGSFNGSFTGSFSGSGIITSASYAATASLAPLYLPLAGGTISGNVTVLGTASINTLIVNQIGYSSGSNQLGDAANDTQTLFGTVVIPTGSLTVSGSVIVSGSDATINGVRVGRGAGNSSDNTAVGNTALNANTTGLYNTAVGFSALALNTTSNNNTALGYAALLLTTGASNTAVGVTALQANTTGTNNTAIGSVALTALSTGSSNIAFGRNAGRYITDGVTTLTNSNTSIFLGTDTKALANSQTNQIVIGDSAIGLGSNSVVLGNDSITRTALKGSVSIGTTGSISSTLHVKGAGATSGTTALRVENTNASASLVVLDNGAVGIGTTSPSSSILLDVSGSIRSFNILPASTGNWDIGVSANRFRNGWFNGVLVAVSTYTNNLFFGVTNLGIYNSTGTQIAQMFGTGDLVLQSGGTFTNNNYRLQVNATGSTNSGSLFLGGTTIATSSIATTMLISSSLSASANSDVLVGLEINPTFTNGAFTGVKNNWINLVGNASVNFTNQLYLKRGDVDVLFASSAETQVKTVSSSAPLKFFVGSTSQYAQFFATTGNFTLQNGGTFTDAGFRLDVSGSARINGGTTISDTPFTIGTRFLFRGDGVMSFGASGDRGRLTWDGSGAYFHAQSGYGVGLGANGSLNNLFINTSGNVGIGTTSPSATLHVSGASSAALLRVDSPAATALFVSGSGNVGIGTITPGQTLTVNGNAQFGLNSTSAGARLHTRGAGNTNASTSFRAENANQSPALRITDDLSARFDGKVSIGSGNFPTASLDIAGTTRISGSFNTAVSGSIFTVIGSGSTQPIFTVQGSQGELFSINDSLSGSLFSVNDISGLPILEVFSDSTTLIGDYLDPMLITTKKVTMTNSGSFVVYSLPTASYDTAFFDYSIKSGSNARAGQIMAIQSGASVNFTETTTTDFGNTTAVSFTVIVSGSNMVLTGSAATGSWTIKSIIRGL